MRCDRVGGGGGGGGGSGGQGWGWGRGLGLGLGEGWRSLLHWCRIVVLINPHPHANPHTSSYFHRSAYEPVWAIGTGLTATPEIAQVSDRVISRKSLLVSSQSSGK